MSAYPSSSWPRGVRSLRSGAWPGASSCTRCRRPPLAGTPGAPGTARRSVKGSPTLSCPHLRTSAFSPILKRILS
jgi:hypothetical protein